MSIKGNLKMSEEKTPSSVRSLEIVEKVMAELKAEDSNKMLFKIIRKLLNASKHSGDIQTLKLNAIVHFLTMLEKSNFEDYGEVFNNFQNYFLSKELRKVTLKGVEIEEYGDLGVGDFGQVALGQIRDSIVAVKKLKCEYVNLTLLPEANIMAALNHENVVKLVAFQKRPMKMAMEHLPYGKLVMAVKMHLISGPDLLKALHDVAKGMEYIASKNIVHRDLDGGNVLVGLEKVCKICDFGNAKYVGFHPNLEYKEQNPVPSSMPPDVINNHIFTTKSDVWLFGSLIMQLYMTEEGTFEKTILQNMKSTLMYTSKKKMSLLVGPKLCPPDLLEYAMSEILHIDTSRRPTFSSIREKIGGMLN